MLPAGIESAAGGLEDRCSIQLSYGSVFGVPGGRSSSLGWSVLVEAVRFELTFLGLKGRFSTVELRFRLLPGQLVNMTSCICAMHCETGFSFKLLRLRGAFSLVVVACCIYAMHLVRAAGIEPATYRLRGECSAG